MPSRPLLRARLRQRPAANGPIPDNVDPSSWPGGTSRLHIRPRATRLPLVTLQQRQSPCALPHRPAEPVLNSRRAPAVKQSVDPSGEVTMEDQDDEDIEAKMEEFLRLQAERESGMSGVACAKGGWYWTVMQCGALTSCFQPDG